MNHTQAITPAGPAPAGVSSNFIDPTNYAGSLVACNVVLLVVSILIVAARMVSRTMMTDWRLGWDDYTILLALIGTAIFGGFVIQTTHYGLGKHIWDVPTDTYSPHYLWWIMATFAACPASYYFVKISILFMYLRVFQLKPNLRYVVYGLFAYCTLYYWLAFFSIIGMCNAENKKWDITLEMNCFAYGKLALAIGGLDLICDTIVLAFPIPLVLKLRISTGQKIYLLFVFLCGFIATIACAIRVAFAAQSRGTSDATMAQYRTVTLFCIEHYFALIAACMPTLGPLFRYLRPIAWRSQQNHPTDRADEATIGHGWPRPTHTHKTSPDSSLLNGSIDIEIPVAGNEQDTRGHYWLPPALSRSVTPKKFGLGWRKPVESVPISQLGREGGVENKEQEAMEMRIPANAAVVTRSL